MVAIAQGRDSWGVDIAQGRDIIFVARAQGRDGVLVWNIRLVRCFHLAG